MLAGLLAAIVLIVVSFAVAVPLAILRGWVLSILWGWFFVPLGVPSVHIAAAIGIALTFGLLLEGLKAEDKHNSEPVKAVFVAILSPFVALGVGYIIHCFQ